MNSNRAIEITQFLLRIVAGLMFAQHGMQKLFGWYGGFGAPGATAPLMSQFGLAGVLELFGGLAILLGLGTRPAAFLLSGEMAVAYFQAHFPHGFWPIQNHGEPAVLFSFIFLFLAAYGGGAWSLDSRLWRPKPRA
jgi:putative oxidoreductase